MARATKADAEIYVARATGIERVGDTEYHYIAGKTRLRAGHPLLKARPEKFKAEALDTETVYALPSVEAPRRVAPPPPEDPVVAAAADVAEIAVRIESDEAGEAKNPVQALAGVSSIEMPAAQDEGDDS